MEAFYQESGRAGRDQLPSRSLLYYGMDDRRRMVGYNHSHEISYLIELAYNDSFFNLFIHYLFIYFVVFGYFCLSF